MFHLSFYGYDRPDDNVAELLNTTDVYAIDRLTKSLIKNLLLQYTGKGFYDVCCYVERGRQYYRTFALKNTTLISYKEMEDIDVR